MDIVFHNKRLPLIVLRPVVLEHVLEVRTADLQNRLVHVNGLLVHFYRKIACRLYQEINLAL